MLKKNEDVQFKSSSIKIPRSYPPFQLTHLHFCSQTLTSTFLRAKFSFTQFLDSLKHRQIPPPPLLLSSTLALTRADPTQSELKSAVTRARREDEDGEELERKDLEMEAMAALKASRPNLALTVREVQEDVHRIIDSGYFSSCMPVAVDTRDGIRLVFQENISSIFTRAIITTNCRRILNLEIPAVVYKAGTNCWKDEA